ncbi:Phosphoribosylglycinamide formyltransferase [Candidatus Magnetomoraceae bacterium gMMP-15]
MKEKIQLGALISGGGTNLQAIIDACEKQTIDAELVFVGTDNPDAKGLQRAEKHNIPSFIVDYSSIIKNYDPKFSKLPDDFDLESNLFKQKIFSGETNMEKAVKFLKTRAIAEKKLLDKMSAYSYDLLVLAGFMRNFTPYFIDRVNKNPENPCIMNIHPALLPSFPGTDGYGDTFRYGCKIGGCTVHFIDYGEDSGSIIGQKSFSIEPDDTLDNIKKKGLQLEWELYPECIQLFAQGKLRTVIKGQKTVVEIS